MRADVSVDGRIREILAGAKACRSKREMTAVRAIWQEARRQAIAECVKASCGPRCGSNHVVRDDADLPVRVWGLCGGTRLVNNGFPEAEIIRALLAPAPASAPEGRDGK